MSIQTHKFARQENTGFVNFRRDNNVDGADLGLLFLAWGPCV